MNNLNKVQIFGPLGLSCVRSRNSSFGKLVCAAFLAGLVLFDGSANASSILITCLKYGLYFYRFNQPSD